MTDWRLNGQELYLKHVDLHWGAYEPPSEEWDHDHCEFCWGEFATQGGDFTEGYTTKDQYHWICEDCYKDFKSIFDWKIVSCAESPDCAVTKEQS
jgi:hypothetical protein